MVLGVNSKLFWGGFTALACASLLFCYRYFAVANPLVNLTISIDRNEAVDISRTIGQDYQWPLEGTHTAVMFGIEQQDFLIQPFADLETGGNNNYRAMITSGLYCPYKWSVRFFKEHSSDEVTLTLMPDGKPYGFEHTLPEDRELPSLKEDAARIVAQNEAQKTWDIDLSVYKEIEASHNTTPKGRIDYTFVYERTDATLMETGKYRLTLKVSGNQVTMAKRSVKIPELFLRTFEAAYSKNSFLAKIAVFLMYIFYLLGGCIIGGYFLFKRNMFFTKTALYWALFVGLLQGLVALNNLPLIWMYYKTSLSISSFLSSYALSAAFQTLYAIANCVFAFSIATSLDNWAFPTHLRFWQLWSPRLGSTKNVFGQTIGGYLGALSFLGSATATYLLFLQVFKWWSPASPLIDPNILATPMPWISAFSMALHAGFWEECLFRAVPLAGAVVLGRYLKKEKLIVSLGFILQIFVFAAAHASYAQQPFYFRLVELVIPSAVFGFVYLAYGLLPGIICHFIYDLILMGTPLWIAQSNSALVHKTILLLLALLPIFILLLRRAKQGYWATPEKQDYNDGNTLYHAESQEQEPKKVYVKHRLSRNSFVFILLAGLVGVTALWYCGKKEYDAPALSVSRTEAIALATKLIPTDFAFAQNHTVLTQLQGRTTPEHIFVWQTSGEETYKALLGSYLFLPSWNIRFVSFDAPADQKAEEYMVVIDAHGKVYTTKLVLPENKALPSLNKSEARGLALQALEKTYGITAHDIEEISAQPTERPARTDWLFTFKYLPTQLCDGYAQVKVALAGNVVQTIERSIFIPETWKRAFEHKESIKGNVGFVFMFIFVLLLIIAISGFGTPFLKRLRVRDTIYLGTTLFGILCLFIINQLPATTGLFSTAQAYSTQLFGVLVSMALLSLLRIIIVSLYTVHISYFVNQSRLEYPGIFCIGLLGGLIIRAAHVFGKWIIPVNIPLWGTYDMALSYFAFFSVAITYILLVLRNVTFGTVAVSFLNTLESRPRNTFFRFIFIFLGVYGSIGAFETVSSGIAIGLAVTTVVIMMYRLLLSYDSTLWIPLLTGYFATYALGESTAHLFAGYGVTMALTGGILILLNYRWFTLIRKDT